MRWLTGTRRARLDDQPPPPPEEPRLAPIMTYRVERIEVEDPPPNPTLGEGPSYSAPFPDAVVARVAGEIEQSSSLNLERDQSLLWSPPPHTLAQEHSMVIDSSADTHRAPHHNLQRDISVGRLEMIDLPRVKAPARVYNSGLQTIDEGSQLTSGQDVYDLIEEGDESRVPARQRSNSLVRNVSVSTPGGPRNVAGILANRVASRLRTSSRQDSALDLTKDMEAGYMSHPGEETKGDPDADLLERQKTMFSVRGILNKRIVDLERQYNDEEIMRGRLEHTGTVGALGGDRQFIGQSSHRPNPQDVYRFASTPFIWLIVLCNVAAGVWYMWWRWVDTRSGVPTLWLWWFYLFYGMECTLTIAVWIGHSQRLFPVNRIHVTMDELAAADQDVAKLARVAVMLPTAGENLEVVLKCLLGAVSQRLWISPLSRQEQLSVLVLDEKKRREVHNMVIGIYEICRLIVTPTVHTILKAEGVKEITAWGFWDWCHDRGGFERKSLYNTPGLNQAILCVKQIDAIIAAAEAGGSDMLKMLPELDSPEEREKALKDFGLGAGKDLISDLNVPVAKGTCVVCEATPLVPRVVYYSRYDSGTPKISPKAGNMNAVLFRNERDLPGMPPLINGSTIVVVNDARHQHHVNFLQRTVPYFFELDKSTMKYRWAKIGFVQTPQRFPPLLEHADDPLGNRAAIQYDVINVAKDGIGAVSSSGQGSLWRVDALHGLRANGTMAADPKDASLIGHKLGFRSEMLIEDTHTSIEIFKMGWRSVYVNEPGEILATCTHQPNSVLWRTKQVLRWHQGGAQLLLFKGPWYIFWGGHMPTIWHRLYAFDQATYYLQAFPGYLLLLAPMIYGGSSQPPFSTSVAQFVLHFAPFILTAVLPTAIAANWRSTDTDRITRDEQVWLSTAYVQIYAFLDTLWSFITRAKPENAWTAKCPIWPLLLVFVGEFLAMLAALFWLIYYGLTWYKSFIAVVLGAGLSLHSIWPMVGMQLKVQIPSFYTFKLVVYCLLAVAAVIYTQGQQIVDALEDAVNN